MREKFMPKTSRRKGLKEAKILLVAHSLLLDYGMRRLTVKDVAHQLEMAPANIFRFFESKADLLNAIAQSTLEKGYEAAAVIASTPEMSAKERLLRILRVRHDFALELCKNDASFDLIKEAYIANWPARTRYDERTVSLISSVIENGIAGGEFCVADPTKSATLVVMATESTSMPCLICHWDTKKYCSVSDLFEMVISALR